MLGTAKCPGMLDLFTATSGSVSTRADDSCCMVHCRSNAIHSSFRWPFV